jgi:hypothetical protein
MTAAELAMMQGVLRDEYVETRRHHRVLEERLRLRMYAVALAHDPEIMAFDGTCDTSIAGPAADVLAAFRR